MNKIHISELARFIPDSQSQGIDWKGLRATTSFGDLSDVMEMVPQNPEYHGEGNVLAHTYLVLESLVSDQRFYDLDERERTTLFVSALYHDIGKTCTTVYVDGKISSPYHSVEGGKLCGSLIAKEPCADNRMRRAISLLVRYHMTPGFLMEKPEDLRERKIQSMTALMAQVPDFSWKLLLMLCEADTKGRIAKDTDLQLDRLSQVRHLLKEKGIDC